MRLASSVVRLGAAAPVRAHREPPKTSVSATLLPRRHPCRAPQIIVVTTAAGERGADPSTRRLVGK